jgi:hypothetical protein
MIVKLDKERNLVFNLNTMAKFEELTGKNIFTDKIFEKIKSTDLRALIWACLVQEDPALTLEQVGAMVTIENMAEITNSFNELIGGNKENPL